MLFSSKDWYQQVCPVGLLGAGWFSKAVFWQPSCPEASTDLWVHIWQHTFQRCSSGWRVGGRGEGGGHRWEWLLSISHFLLPVEEIFSTGSSNCPPTRSHCSQECKLETWGHISLTNSRGILVHFQQFRESWVIWMPLLYVFTAGARWSMCFKFLWWVLLFSASCYDKNKKASSITLSNVYWVTLYWKFIFVLGEVSICCCFLLLCLQQKHPTTVGIWMLWKCDIFRHRDKLCIESVSFWESD